MKPLARQFACRAATLLALLLMLGTPLLNAKTPPLETLLAELPPPPADAAQIVFLKPSDGALGFGVMPAGILEIVGDQRKLLGVMNFRARLVVTVAPGSHLFMSHDKGYVHFLDAKVEAGKRYFVLVRMIYTLGHQMRPIRPNGTSDYDMSNPDFVDWLDDTQVKPARRQQIRDYEKRDAKVAEAQAQGWARWLRKTDDERAQLTLRPEDGL
jgi:hypothetical protein